MFRVRWNGFPPGTKTFALSALLPSQKTLHQPDIGATKVA
jgi:hypothetical protein